MLGGSIIPGTPAPLALMPFLASLGIDTYVYVCTYIHITNKKESGFKNPESCNLLSDLGKKQKISPQTNTLLQNSSLVGLLGCFHSLSL